MAYYCIDYINGSDVTGDGTASAPWATIAHGESQINGGAGYVTGDEMRIAASPRSAKIASINGAVTTGSSSDWTCPVDTDLTGVLSPLDTVWFTGESNATRGGSNFIFQVKSVTSTQVVFHNLNGSSVFLGQQLFKDDSTLAAVDLHKITPVEVDVTGFSSYYDQINTQGQLLTTEDAVTISGGWDPANFTSQTAYGMTSISRIGTYQSSSYFTYGGGFRFDGNMIGFKLANFNTSRIYIGQDLNFSDNTFAWNAENISPTSWSGAGSSTPTNKATWPRKFTNCKLYTYVGISGRNDNVNLIGSSFTDCQFMNYSNYPLIAGTSSTSSTHKWELSGSGNWHTKAGFLTSYDITNRLSSTVSVDPNQPLLQDFTKLNIYNRAGSTPAVGIVNSGSVGGKIAYTIDIPTGIFGTGQAITRLTSKSTPYANGLTFNFANLSDATTYAQGIIQAGKMNVGAWPFNISGGGKTLQVLGYKLNGTLNTVDNNLGDNCIELVPQGNVLEGPWMPLAFKKGDNIEVTIIGKIKGTATSMSPAIRLAGTDAQGPETSYDSFEGLANFSNTSGSGYNNTTWSTNVYTITNAFANESFADYSGQLAIYSDQLNTASSFLIDSVTINIT